jgi:hypothetical protein
VTVDLSSCFHRHCDILNEIQGNYNSDNQKGRNSNFVGLDLGYSISHFQKILKLSGMEYSCVDSGRRVRLFRVITAIFLSVLAGFFPLLSAKHRQV